jgi:hypothetical protein
MDIPKKDGDTTPQADAEPSRDAKQSADTNEGSDSNDGAKRKSVDERLSDLDEKIDQLKNKRDGILARKRARDRKRETRRKIILGALMLTLAGESEKFRDFLRKNLDQSIKSERDRELFADLLTKKSQK